MKRPARELTRKNHTATHLLHWALRKVLGEGVKQHGSVVDPDRLRFDFDHGSPVTYDQLQEVERLVNEKVYDDLTVCTQELPIDQARRLPGVRAFFGEKYGDWVLDVLEYDSADGLLEVLEPAVVRPALEKADQLLRSKAEELRKRHVRDYR